MDRSSVSVRGVIASFHNQKSLFEMSFLILSACMATGNKAWTDKRLSEKEEPYLGLSGLCSNLSSAFVVPFSHVLEERHREIVHVTGNNVTDKDLLLISQSLMSVQC